MHPECTVTSPPPRRITAENAVQPRSRFTAKTDSGPIGAGPKRPEIAPRRRRRRRRRARRKGTGLEQRRLPICASRPAAGYKSGPTRTIETADLS